MLWLGIAIVGGACVLVWHEWANTKHPDQSWLDPEQPPAQVDVDPARVPAAPRPRRRPYPGSLMAWGCSPIGDC